MNSRHYTVVVKRSAEREMDRFPPDLRDRILRALLRLETVPRPVGCKKLSVLDRYRIRVGDYRVLYSVDDRDRRVAVVSVEHRRQAYRRR